MKKIFSFIFITIFIVFSALIYARFVEPNLLTVRYENMSSGLLNEDEDKLKILMFSDTHISSHFDENDLKRAVERINGEAADIVVFGGDLIDEFNTYENKDNINELWEILSEIKAPSGKYAVYGNHDYGGGAERVYAQIMENSGFMLLKNEKIQLNDYNINIIGMDDSIFGDYDRETITGMLDKDRYNIVLSHEPDVIDFLLEYDADLFLSGHSHGGQINLPFLDSLPLLAKKYTRGLYSFDNFRQTKLYVNIGLGTSQIPMRFMAVPELTVITLGN
ncbi:metallophosphoesterase [Sedimentibacter sp.]|uniref:metallophosphoesterase n=1 Tax=Sedimentibacter sp. TaxID=1960295 RepID=UPI00289F071C|nr:metallophosphoesterase [Sedimentibacter sp.]